MTKESEETARDIASEALRQMKKQIIVLFVSAILGGLAMNYKFMTSISDKVDELRTMYHDQQEQITDLQKIVYRIDK